MKYLVSVDVTVSKTIEVEATTEQEAGSIAEKKAMDSYDFRFCTIINAKAVEGFTEEIMEGYTE